MPISSMQIQQMMAQTNSGFAQNQAYAQGLTAANPLARYEHNLGAGIPNSNTMIPQGPFAAQAAPGIAQAGANAMGGVGFGVTMGAAFGLLPRFMDPFTQGIHTISGAYRTAGMGGAIGMGLGIGGAYLAVGQAANYMTGKIIQGAQEQAHSMGMFSANLGNSGIGGMGGIGGATAAANAVQGIASMATSSGLGSNINIGSVSNVMAMGMQGGQFRGVSGVTAFKKRLSKLTAEATAMANMLGSSIEEAAGTLQSIEQQFGLKGSSAISFVGQMGAMQGVSGMGVTQQMAQAQFGSGMFQSMGLSRVQGARYGVGLAQRVGGAVQMGAIGRNAIADIGGQEQATARFTQSAVRIFSGRDGMRLLGAMMDEHGELDTSMAYKIATGGMNKKEILKEYKKRVKGKAGRGMLLANRAELIGGFMEEHGPEGALSALEGLNTGRSDSEFRNLAMSGLTGREMDLLRNLRGQSGNLRAEMYAAARRGLAKSPTQGKSISDVLGGMVDKVLQPIEETFTGWGRDIHSAVTGFLDDVSRDLSGKGAARQPLGVRSGGAFRGMGAAIMGGAAWAGHSNVYGAGSPFQSNLRAGLNSPLLGELTQAGQGAGTYGQAPLEGAPSAIPGGFGGGGGFTPDWERMAGGTEAETWLGSMVPSGIRYAQRGGDPTTLDNWGMFPTLYGAERPSDFQSNMVRGLQMHGALTRAPGMIQAGLAQSAMIRAGVPGAVRFGATATSPIARAAVSAAGSPRLYSAMGRLAQMGGLSPVSLGGNLLRGAGSQLLRAREFMAAGQYLGGGRVAQFTSSLFKSTGLFGFGGRGTAGAALSLAGNLGKGVGAALGAVSRVANKAFLPLMLLEPAAHLFGGDTPGSDGSYAEGITGNLGRGFAAAGGIWGDGATGFAPAGTGFDPNMDNRRSYAFTGGQMGVNTRVGNDRVWIGAGSGGMGATQTIDGEEIHHQMWLDTKKAQQMVAFYTGGITDTTSLQRAFGEEQGLTLMRNDLRSLSTAYQENLASALVGPRGDKALGTKEWQQLQEDVYLETIRNASGDEAGGGNSPNAISKSWTGVLTAIAGMDGMPRRQEIQRLMKLGQASTASVSRAVSEFKHANLMYSPNMSGKDLREWQDTVLVGAARRHLTNSYAGESKHLDQYNRHLAEYKRLTETALEGGKTATGVQRARYVHDAGVGSLLVFGTESFADPNVYDELARTSIQGMDLEDAFKKVTGIDPDTFAASYGTFERQRETSGGTTTFETGAHWNMRRMAATRALNSYLQYQHAAKKGDISGGGMLLGHVGYGGTNTAGSDVLTSRIRQDPELRRRVISAGETGTPELFQELFPEWKKAFIGGITDQQVEGIPDHLYYKGTKVTGANIKALTDQALTANSKVHRDDFMRGIFAVAITSEQADRNEAGKTFLTALREEADGYSSFTSSTGYSAGQAVLDGGGSQKAARLLDGLLKNLSDGTRNIPPGMETGDHAMELQQEVAGAAARFREEIGSMAGEDLIDLGEHLAGIAHRSGNTGLMQFAQVATSLGGFKSGKPKSDAKVGTVSQMGKDAAKMLGLTSSKELALVGIGKSSHAKRVREYIKQNKALPLSSELELKAGLTRKLSTSGLLQPGGMQEDLQKRVGGGVHAAAAFQLDVVKRRVYGHGEHTWVDPITNKEMSSHDKPGLSKDDYERTDVQDAGVIGQELRRQGSSGTGAAAKTEKHVQSIISNIGGLDQAIGDFIQRLTGK